MPADPDSAVTDADRRWLPLRKVQVAEGHAQFRERHGPGKGRQIWTLGRRVEVHADATRQPVGSAGDGGRVQAHHAGADTGRSPAPRDLDGQRGQQVQRNLAGGKSYHVIMKCVGSQLSIRYENDDDLDTPPPREETITWTKTRKGAIGFLIPPGARFKATSLKVRELR